MSREQISRIAFVMAFSLFAVLVYYYLSKQSVQPAPEIAVKPSVEPEPPGPTQTPAKRPTSRQKIDVNTATADQLTTLPGIGPALAKAIVSYRQKNRFNSIEEIQNVKGIGPALFAKIKSRLTV